MDILNFLKEFWAVLIGIITLITTLVKLFAKVNVMEKDILSLKNNVEKITGNYLSKFTEIKDKMTLQHDELIKEITKLTIMVEKQTTFCQVVQDMKKNNK